MIHYFEQKYSLKLVYIETIWWWFCVKFKSSPSIWYDITKKGNSSLSRNSQEFMDQDRFWWIIGQPWSKWKRKWQTDLIPALDCIARRLGLVVEEDDVDLLGQLGHGGEDEGERRDDHHRHRRERTYLRKSALFAQEAIVLRLTLAANEVSGYSVKFHKYFRTLSLFFIPPFAIITEFLFSPLTVCSPRTPPLEASAGIAAQKVVGQRFPEHHRNSSHPFKHGNVSSIIRAPCGTKRA